MIISPLGVLLNSPASASTEPPVNGSDWTILVDEVVRKEGQTTTLTSNIHLKGTMLLENSELIINSDSNGQHSIDIEDSGKLFVINSTIRSPNGDYSTLEVYGTLYIINSTIAQAQINVFSPNVTVAYSTIENAQDYGIYVQGGLNINVTNSTFKGCGVYYKGDEQPDLTGKLIFNPVITEGLSYSVGVEVINTLGDAQDFEISVYVDNLLISTDDTYSLPGGSTMSVLFPWSTADKAGYHYISAIIDGQNVVDEIDESNNVLDGKFYVNAVPMVDLSVISNEIHPLWPTSFQATTTDTGELTYKWDFDGNGVFENITSDNVINYSYQKSGTYMAEVVAVDEYGASSSDTFQVIVTDVPWWDNTWKYRELIMIDVNEYYPDMMIEKDIDFQAIINDVSNGQVDINSIRMVEWSDNMNNVIPSYYTDGKLFWIMDKSMSESRYFYVYFSDLSNGQMTPPEIPPFIYHNSIIENFDTSTDFNVNNHVIFQNGWAMLNGFENIKTTSEDFNDGTFTNTEFQSDINDGVIRLAGNLPGPFALLGTYESIPLDAGINSFSWTGGMIDVASLTPPGTSISVSFRASNDPSFSGVPYTPLMIPLAGTGRYLQYELTLSTMNNMVTPFVDMVRVTGGFSIGSLVSNPKDSEEIISAITASWTSQGNINVFISTDNIHYYQTRNGERLEIPVDGLGNSISYKIEFNNFNARMDSLSIIYETNAPPFTPSWQSLNEFDYSTDVILDNGVIKLQKSTALAFDDTFDDNTVGQLPTDWVVVQNGATTIVHVANDNSHSPTNSVIIKDSNPNKIASMTRSFDPSEQLVCSFSILKEGSGALFIDIGKPAKDLMNMKLQSGSISILSNGVWNSIMNYNDGTWYNFKIDVNAVFYQYNIYIDSGSTIASTLRYTGTFTNTIHMVNTLKIYTDKVGTLANAWVDDVSIEYYSADNFDLDDNGIDPVGWTVKDTEKKNKVDVTDSIFHGSSGKSVFIYDTSIHVSSMKKDFIALNTISFSFSIRFSDTIGGLYIDISDSSAISAVGLIFESGNMYYRSSSGQEYVSAYSNNIWYNNELIINPQTNRFDWYLGTDSNEKSLIGSNLVFANTVTNLALINIYTGININQNGAWLDDVNIKTHLSATGIGVVESKDLDTYQGISNIKAEWTTSGAGEVRVELSVDGGATFFDAINGQYLSISKETSDSILKYRITLIADPENQVSLPQINYLTIKYRHFGEPLFDTLDEYIESTSNVIEDSNDNYRLDLIPEFYESTVADFSTFTSKNNIDIIDSGDGALIVSAESEGGQYISSVFDSQETNHAWGRIFWNEIDELDREGHHSTNLLMRYKTSDNPSDFTDIMTFNTAFSSGTKIESHGRYIAYGLMISMEGPTVRTGVSSVKITFIPDSSEDHIDTTFTSGYHSGTQSDGYYLTLQDNYDSGNYYSTILDSGINGHTWGSITWQGYSIGYPGYVDPEEMVSVYYIVSDDPTFHNLDFILSTNGESIRNPGRYLVFIVSLSYFNSGGNRYTPGVDYVSITNNPTIPITIRDTTYNQFALGEFENSGPTIESGGMVRPYNLPATYTSRIFDSGEINHIWSTMEWDGTGQFKLFYRTGNSDPIETDFISIEKDAPILLKGRFIQYKVEFTKINDALDDVVIYSKYLNWGEIQSITIPTLSWITSIETYSISDNGDGKTHLFVSSDSGISWQQSSGQTIYNDKKGVNLKYMFRLLSDGDVSPSVNCVKIKYHVELPSIKLLGAEPSSRTAVTISGDNEIYSETSVDFNAMGGSTYSWDFDYSGVFKEDINTQTGEVTHSFEYPGEYTVAVRAQDASGYRSIAFMHVRVSPLLSDLIVTAVQLSPQIIKSSEKTEVTIHLQNTGQKDALKVDVGVFYRQYDGQDTLSKLMTINEIDQGQEIANSFVWYPPYPGVFTLTFRVDPLNTIPENNEINNDFELFTNILGKTIISNNTFIDCPLAIKIENGQLSIENDTITDTDLSITSTGLQLKGSIVEGDNLEITTDTALDLDNSDLTLRASYLLGDGLHLKATSSTVNAIDSHFDFFRADAVSLTESDVHILWSVSITILNDVQNKQPQSGINIRFEHGDSIDLEKTTGNDGTISGTIEMASIDDSINIETPHILYVGDTSIPIFIAETQSHTLYYSGIGDTDLDDDNSPDNKEVYGDWSELEGHALKGSDVTADSLASPFTSFGNATSTVNPYSFPLSTGTYRIALRAKGDGGLTIRIDNSVLSQHALSSDYKWFVTPTFSVLTPPKIEFTGQVLLDKICFFENTNPMGQITDPTVGDSDFDRIPDGLETRDHTFWYEAELYSSSSIIQDINAGSGRAVQEASPNNAVTISESFAASTTQIIGVRAVGRTVNDDKIRISLGDLTSEMTISDDGYLWYTHEFQLDAEKTSLNIDVTAGTVRIDSVYVALKSEIEKDDFIIDGNMNSVESATLSYGPGVSSHTVHISLPKEAVVTSATLTFNCADANHDNICDDFGEVKSALIFVPFPNIFSFQQGEMDSFGDYIVFTGVMNNNKDIYLYDISAGVLKRLTGTGIVQQHPAIYEDVVIWEEVTATGTNLRLLNLAVYKNILSGMDSDHDGISDYLDPDANGDGTPDILNDYFYQYDIALCSISGSNPDIYNNLVVYQDSLNPPDIHSIDITTCIDNRISTDDPLNAPTFTDTNPKISGEMVVWIRNGNKIQFKHLGSGYTNTFDVSNIQIGGGTPRGSVAGSPLNFGVSQIFQAGFPINSLDISGTNIVFETTNMIKLIDLTKDASTQKLLGIGNSPRVWGDKVIWASAPGAKMIDLSHDGSVPFTLENQATSAVSLYGDIPHWLTGNTIKYTAMDYQMKLGDDVLWERTEAFSGDETSQNIAKQLNSYLNTHIGATIDVPLILSSGYNGGLAVKSIDVKVEFSTDPLNADTDGDHLCDGDEVLAFFGYGMIEIEDAIDLHEWVNPLSKDPNVRLEDDRFMHETGVTITSSHNYAGNEGYMDSWVKLKLHASDTNRYLLRIAPDEKVVRMQEITWVEGPYGYYPVTLDGNNVKVNPTSMDYINNVLAQALEIKVSRDGTYDETPIDDTVKIQNTIERIELGKTLSIDDDSDAQVQIQLGYSAQYNLRADTDYEILIHLDISKAAGVPVPASLPFTNLMMLRILNLDFIRLERIGTDPMNPDTDGDKLNDNVEATDTGYPLTSDADGDGLIDLTEMQEGTNPHRRDSDMDGIRDGIELGYCMPNAPICNGLGKRLDGKISSMGSWFERLMRYQNPFDLTPIQNDDGDKGSTTTNPLDPDTDKDGLPDGWTDGWSYQAGPLNTVAMKTYHQTDRISKANDYRYDISNWGQSGLYDNLVQVYEGEDLNGDGTCAGGFAWGFDDQTLERKSILMGETDPANIDSDNDRVPEGYEVWYSTIEPHVNPNNNQYFLDPTNFDAQLDIDIDEGPIYETSNPDSDVSSLQIDSKYSGMTLAIPNYLDKIPGEDVPISKMTSISLYLSGSGPDSKAIVEIWDICEFTNLYDAALHATLTCPEVHPKDPKDEPYTSMTLNVYNKGWYTVDVPDYLNRQVQFAGIMVVVQYMNGIISWHYGSNIGGAAGTAFNEYSYNGVTWTTINLINGNNLKVRINGYLPGGTGDHLTNLQEYIIASNPKNRNTDSITLGSETTEDYLLDGEEAGWNAGEVSSGTNCPQPYTNNQCQGGFPIPEGGIILYTNIPMGAVKASAYIDSELQSTDIIKWDPDGGGASTGDQWSYQDKNVNPTASDKAFLKDNIVLYTLDDGGEIRISQDQNYLFVIPSDVVQGRHFTDTDGIDRISGTIVEFSYSGSADLSGFTYENNGDIPFGRIVTLSNANMVDSDFDGIVDGLEVDWNQDSDSDLIPNVRDSDSDNDGLSDSQEVAYAIDSDNDGMENMIDPDSDNDGLIDGQEDMYMDDTDGQGSEVSTDVTLSGHTFKLEYNNDVNALDSDSDNDGISDGIEKNPFELSSVIDSLIDMKSISASYIKAQDGLLYFINDGHIKYIDPYFLNGWTYDITDTKVDANGPFSISGKDYYYIHDNNIDKYDTATFETTADYIHNPGSVSQMRIRGDELYYSVGDELKIKDSYNDPFTRVVTTSTIIDFALTSSGTLYILTADRIYKYEFSRPNCDNDCDLVPIVQKQLGVDFYTSIDIDYSGELFLSDGTSLKYLDAQRDEILPIVGNDDHLHAIGNQPVTFMTVDNDGNIYFATSTKVEAYYYAATNMLNIDSDGDGLLDGADIGSHANPCEFEQLGIVTFDGVCFGELEQKPLTFMNRNTRSITSPVQSDSDMDGLSDGLELYGWRVSYLEVPMAYGNDWVKHKIVDQDGNDLIMSDPSDKDTDDDGIKDSNEYLFTSPQHVDSDFDTIGDGVENANHNGKLDRGETNPLSQDTDLDYLPDGPVGGIPGENELGTSPLIRDTDKDGIWDGTEYHYYHDRGLVNVEDVDNDGLDYYLDPDSDNDGLKDGAENFDYDNALDTYPAAFSHGVYYNYDGTEAVTDGDSMTVSAKEVDVEYIIDIQYPSQYTFTTTYSASGTNPSLTFKFDGNEKVLVDGKWSYTPTLDGLKYHSISIKFTQDDAESVTITLDIDNMYFTEPPVGKMIPDIIYCPYNFEQHNLETDPFDPDSDNDGLMDGAEYSPFSDTDSDGYVNAWDQDSNDQVPNNVGGGTVYGYDLASTSRNDYIQTYVVLRKGTGDYLSAGMWIAVDPNCRETQKVNLYYNEMGGGTDTVHPLSTLTRYELSSVTSTLPSGAELMSVYYGSPTNPAQSILMTPEGNLLYFYQGQIYVYVQGNQAYGVYTASVETPPETSVNIHSIPQSMSNVNSYDPNYVMNGQEGYDARPAINLDSDFDGIENGLEILIGTNPNDADTDNDGILDGAESLWYIDSDKDGKLNDNSWVGGRKYLTGINALDADSDNDGIIDGIEIGLTADKLDPDTFVNRISLTDERDQMYVYPIIFKSGQDPDADPSTTTDPLNPDTDADGLVDGWTDTNQNGIFDIGEGEDKNTDGRFDIGETNPLDADTDDDGIIDGTEVLTYHSDPLIVDTDNDGLLDGTEVGLTWAMISSDTDIEKGNFISDMDPNTQTDPANSDSDGDGILDGWIDQNGNGQYDIGEGEDRNLNGKEEKNETNPMDCDTDKDGLLDGFDVVSTTADKFGNIYYTTESSNYRYWGELSLHDLYRGTEVDAHLYQKSATDPLKKDSDNDGLIDGPGTVSEPGELSIHFTQASLYASLVGAEFNVLHRPYIFINTIDTNNDGQLDAPSPYFHEQNAFTDPSKSDTDQDGLQDGIEVGGWSNTIIWEKTRDKAYEIPQGLSRSNPVYYLKDSGFKSKDTDEDGLNDSKEFQNSSNPLLEDTDGDHIYDFEEGLGNATCIEGSDPEIVGKVHAKFDYVWDGWSLKEIKIQVTVHVKDNAGIDYVIIEAQDAGESTIVLPDTDATPIHKKTDDGIERDFYTPVRDRTIISDNLKANFFGAFLTGYNINVKAYDVNGYGVKGECHLESIAEGPIDFLINALIHFIKAILDALNYNWIWKQIQAFFNNIGNTVNSALNSFIDIWYNGIEDMFFKGDSAAFLNILNMLFTSIGLMDIVVSIICWIAVPFTTIVFPLIAALTGFILPIMISMIVPGTDSNKRTNNPQFSTSSFIPAIKQYFNKFISGLFKNPIHIYFHDPLNNDFGRYDPLCKKVGEYPSQDQIILDAFNTADTITTYLDLIIGSATANEILVFYFYARCAFSITTRLTQICDLLDIIGFTLSVLSLLICALTEYKMKNTLEKKLNNYESDVTIDIETSIASLWWGFIFAIGGLLTVVASMLLKPEEGPPLQLAFSLICLVISTGTLILSYVCLNKFGTDNDGDGLTNFQENQDWEIWIDYNSNGIRDNNEDKTISLSGKENNQDVDMDGLPDGYELGYPLQFGTRSDGDQHDLLNKRGVRYITNPLEKDTDHDGLMDGGDIIGRKQFDITDNLDEIRDDLNNYDNILGPEIRSEFKNVEFSNAFRFSVTNMEYDDFRTAINNKDISSLKPYFHGTGDVISDNAKIIQYENKIWLVEDGSNTYRIIDRDTQFDIYSDILYTMDLSQPNPDKPTGPWQKLGWQIIDEKKGLRYSIRDLGDKLRVYGFEPNGNEKFVLLANLAGGPGIDVGELTVGTNPVIPDTDGDGIIDGNEVQYWGEVGSDFSGTSFIENIEFEYNGGYKYNDWNGIKYLDSKNVNGINYLVMTKSRHDIWSGFLTTYNDAPWYSDDDHDGIINILDKDSDNDGLLDGEEVFGYSKKDQNNGATINPNDYTDENGNKYYDGPSLPIKSYHRGEGYRYKSDTSMVEDAGLMSDPGNPDTDGDTAVDKWDLHPFYNVKIIITLETFSDLGNTGWYDIDDKLENTNDMELNIKTSIISKARGVQDGDPSTRTVQSSELIDKPSTSRGTINIKTGDSNNPQSVIIELDINDNILINGIYQDRAIDIEMSCWDDDRGGTTGSYDSLIDNLLDIDGRTSGGPQAPFVYLIHLDPYSWKYTTESDISSNSASTISFPGPNQNPPADGSLDKDNGLELTGLDAKITFTIGLSNI